jgi:aryl-alcohol dehydrogenase-like predicted oxidoreductase
VDPIASAPEYAVDVRRARLLGAHVNEGHAASVVEASLRFALSVEGVSTVLLGYSSLDQLETAAAAVNRGPVAPAALDRLEEIWRSPAFRASTASPARAD